VTLDAGELAAAPRLPIHAGAPPQFGGTDAVWSPEELLVGAALLCLQTTFDALVRREPVGIRSWRGTGTGVLDKAPGGPVFTVIRLEVDLVTAAGDETRAERLLRDAERRCIISRALNVPVELAITVRAADALAS
jgi:organic hydroperoxide reductase OsmC/OhrA